MIEVEGFESDFHADLVRDVMPVFGKAGCNAGVCHGSKKGKGGLKTSLRGNDPSTSCEPIPTSWPRVASTLHLPETASCCSRQPPPCHTRGDRFFARGTSHYEIVRKWIAEGAEIDRSSPRVADIEISRKTASCSPTDGRQQYRVLATYTDGEVRDVTAEALSSAWVTSRWPSSRRRRAS